MLLNRNVFVELLLFVLCSSGCTTAISYAGYQEPLIKIVSFCDGTKKEKYLDLRLLRK